MNLGNIPGPSNVPFLHDMFGSVTSGTPYSPASGASNNILESMPNSTHGDALSTVTIDLRNMRSIDAERWCGIIAAETEPRTYETPSFDPLSWDRSVHSDASSPDAIASSGPLDAQTGINFILE